jgi:type III secretion protein O
MRYPLSGILFIRDFRLEAASRTLRAAKAALRAAQAEQARREEALSAYRLWRIGEVERRYQSIMNQCMTMEEIDAFKAGLSRLADEELAREAAVREAENAVENARKNMDAARQAWIASDRERQKIRYHRDEWQTAQAKETARSEDLEQEEFKPVLFEQAAEADD